jgi:ABC-type multidrug transport system fused ATPase/permease subunit
LRLQHGGITINYSANASIKTLELMEETSSNSPDKFPSSKDMLDFEPRAEFKQLTYFYVGNKQPALKNVEFEINVGDFVAIVGPTGAGKSTLIEILLGIRNPSHGAAIVSGEKACIVHELWPGKVAYVPQDVFIRNGSLRENLLLGLPEDDYSDETLISSLKRVGLLSFILDSKMDLDSPLGEDGSTLSGGQRQRIGIARALLTKPELLVLDEATSSLDGVTELEISNTFKEMKSVKTLVVIAHRLSTIREANKLIYLQDGGVRFSGSIQDARLEIPDFDVQARLMGLN